MKLRSPSTQRNKEPILEILRTVVIRRADGEPTRVLEVASGAGEHAIFFGTALPFTSWQPSDPSDDALASIDAWRGEAANVLPALRLDVVAGPFPSGPFDAIVNINMIHISPWAAAESLVRGAGVALGPSGVLFLYGPYKRGGTHTAPSNAAFDESLRARDPSWGVRDLESVVQLAEEAGLMLAGVHEMPANNLSVVFRRRDVASS